MTLHASNNSPTRTDIIHLIDQLIAGAVSREDASLWATARIDIDSADELIDDALSFIAIIDAQHTGTSDYIYSIDQIIAIGQQLAVN